MDNKVNRISLTIPEADLQAIQDAIGVLQDKLLPHLIALSPEDRGGLPKMGDKTVAFVQKAVDYMRDNPELIPGYLDHQEMERDLGAVDRLGEFLRPLSQLAAGLDDSMMAAGSEAYATALAYYQAVKVAARLRVPGAEAIAADLGERFPGRRTRSATAG